jgi:hypothetical protein
MLTIGLQVNLKLAKNYPSVLMEINSLLSGIEVAE